MPGRFGNKYLVISVIGSHAGEGIKAIFDRKKKEVADTGLCYWLIKSFKARTERVQKVCRKAADENEKVFCLFISPSAKNGARPTIHAEIVEEFSEDNKNWAVLPEGIKITGKIDRFSTALVFDDIQILHRPLSFDLSGYSEFETNLSIKFQLGASTVCAESSSVIRTPARFRNVIATGELHPPYAVWLR